MGTIGSSAATMPCEYPQPLRDAGGLLPDGVPCTICGGARPLALIAFDAERQTIAVCKGCIERPTTLRAIVTLLRPNPLLGACAESCRAS